MLVELVRGDCGDGKTCPALYRTDRGTAVVQGRTVTDSELLGRLDLAAGAEAVEVPAGLLTEDAASWPAAWRTDHETLVVTGTPVEEADVLGQLRLAADERAVEVRADLVAGVLQAC